MINESLVENLTDEFKRTFRQNPLIVRSPGRVNIIGEHTDYNEGYVLPAAIDKACYLAIGLRKDQDIHLVAKDLNQSNVTSLSHIKPAPDGGWPNYILGVVAQLQHRGIAVPGFNAVVSSDIPIGAGLSSSAALECATAFALDALSGARLTRLEMVKMAQKAEHEYAGVQCGIMDQFASMLGKKDHVIRLDCRTLAYDYIPFKLEGLKILLLNTNVKHALASSEYNTRRKECEQAVEWVRAHIPGVNALRDITEGMLDRYVRPKDQNIDARARFVVQEIARLTIGCEDLAQGHVRALGEKMFATHYGLQDMYQVSCPELDFLVNAVAHKKEVIGARMMGGGFGGCTINLVEEQAIPELIRELKPLYERQTNLPLSYYITSIEDGTTIIKP